MSEHQIQDQVVRADGFGCEHRSAQVSPDRGSWIGVDVFALGRIAVETARRNSEFYAIARAVADQSRAMQTILFGRLPR